MMRYWAALAVAMVAIFAGTGCNDYGNTFQGNTGAFLQFVSPGDVSAGGPDLTITLTGTGFVAQTYVTFDQQKIATTVTTDPASGAVLTVTAVIPAADTAKPGTHFIQTVNPHSGSGTNGLSNPVSFVVNPAPNPTPAITGISPTTAPACGTSCANAGVALTISGSNFLPPSSGGANCAGAGGATIPCVSQVNWNMGSSQMTFTTAAPNPSNLAISANSIQLNLPGSLLANAGSAVVTVYNPPLAPPPSCVVNCGNGGGGTSACPLISGSATQTVCTFTISATGPKTTSANATSIEPETPALSADGRYVAYAGSQDGHSQIFARDTCQGANSDCRPRTVLVSAGLDGTAGSDDSHAPAMSADGRYVAFSSAATNLANDAATPVGRQVYLRDTCFGATGTCTPATQLISTDPNGSLVGTEAILPSVSASGRYVAFLAVTPSLAKPDHTSSGVKGATHTPNSGVRQVFLRDTCLGASSCTPATTRISLQPGDGNDNSGKPAGPALGGSADHLALASGNTSTLFTRSIAVADDVVLAATKPGQP